MSYKYLTDIQLMNEAGILDNLIRSLVSQVERLTKLKAEGKVSDSTCIGVSDDMKRKAEVIASKSSELLSAAKDIVKQMDDENTQLKHQLEIWEVKYTVGSISEDRYKMIREGISTQLAELEQTKEKIDEFIAYIPENLRRLDQRLSHIVVAEPQKRAIIKQVEVLAQPATETPVAVISQVEAKPIQTFVDTTKLKIKRCSRCQADNQESASFCYNCGTKL
jgi:ribosomal protein L40E